MTIRHEWTSEGREFDPHSGHVLFFCPLVLSSCFQLSIDAIPSRVSLGACKIYVIYVGIGEFPLPSRLFQRAYPRHKILAAD